MVTIEEDPVFIAKSSAYSSESDSYFGHEFFEAPSIRKKGEYYYFIYSSIKFHELCYMMSKNPREGFEYKGVLVSGGDLHIDTYKPAEKCAYYTANNHGSMVQIKDDWFIFYHRHTNGNWFNRQGCAEKMKVMPDGTIPQVQITSCGLNGGPLEGKGEYPAYIACNIFKPEEKNFIVDIKHPRITQDGKDGDEEAGYIANVQNGYYYGFKYFDFKNVKKISIMTRGYVYGKYEVRTKWDGPVLAEISAGCSNLWETNSADINIPDGIGELYFKFVGAGSHQFKGFILN